MNQPLQNHKHLTAICVDDSEFDRTLHDRVLKRSGAFEQVLHFASGEAALDDMRAAPRMPDVIFLDVHMPVMSGFDFLAAATAEFGDRFTSRVVIMLTTSLNPADRARAESFGGVRDYLNKPLTIDEAHMVAERSRIIVQGAN